MIAAVSIGLADELPGKEAKKAHGGSDGVEVV